MQTDLGPFLDDQRLNSLQNPEHQQILIICSLTHDQHFSFCFGADIHVQYVLLQVR